LAAIEEGLKAVGGIAMTPDMKTKQAKTFGGRISRFGTS
jgi:hypothetical protein